MRHERSNIREVTEHDAEGYSHKRVSDVPARPSSALDSAFSSVINPTFRSGGTESISWRIEVVQCLVTGVAGFIGSHLAEKLVEMGHFVIGVDKFSTYYDPAIKRSNLTELFNSKSFGLIHKDVNTLTLEDLRGTEIVFHEAAQPGVRSSWGKEFDAYVSDNILATQRLLELSRRLELKRFVYASSSSVYGEAERSVSETDSTKPISPYGITKLAAESLCMMYYRAYTIPATSLRYFTVYGPRQRPDMAFHRFIRSAIEQKPIVIFGNGNQRRDFTYVQDVVNANVASIEAECVGRIFNIAAGSSITLKEAVIMIEELTGTRLDLRYEPAQRGDLANTSANIDLARKVLSFEPSLPFREGLKAEVDWLRRLLEVKVARESGIAAGIPQRDVA